MKIGLGGGAATIERIIEQAQEAEASGFTTLWYPSAVLGDPLVPIAVAGRATSSIELGTAVLQTYTAHPLLTAARATSVSAAMGRPGFALGIGPSHDRAVEGVYGLSSAHVGRHTEEYTRVLVAALQGHDVHVDGEEFQVHAGAPPSPPYPVPVLLGALAPRMLRVAGEVADGTVTWMANRTALEEHVVPRIRAAASAAGRPAPRIVAGLPVAVHDDVREAHDDAARQYGFYGELPNYARICAPAVSSARRMPASSATRTRWPRNCEHSSTRARPTCGPRSSPWVLTGRPHAHGQRAPGERSRTKTELSDRSRRAVPARNSAGRRRTPRRGTIIDRNAAGAMTSKLVPNCRSWLRIATVSGCVARVGEHEPDQQVVPDPQELEDRQRRDRREADRDHDGPEDLPFGRTVDPCGLEQLAGDAGKEIAQQEDGEGQPERDVEQHDAEMSP